MTFTFHCGINKKASSAADNCPMEENRMRVCAALIEQDGRYLITQRPPDKARGLLWEFPGGKVEDGESPEWALKRELLEELDVVVEVGDLFETHTHRYDDLCIELMTFRCTLVDGSPTPIGVHAIQWVSPSELAHFPITDADQKTVQRIQNKA